MMDILKNFDLDTFILVTCSLIVAYALWSWHSDKHVKFDIKTLILDDKGNFSVYYVAQILSLMTSTWILIYQTRHGILTEWLFTGYMVAWAGMGVAGKWMDNKNNQPPSDSK